MIKAISLDLPDSETLLYPDFYLPQQARALFKVLYEEIPWQAERITVFGKTYDQPRLTAWFAEKGKSYSYSNLVLTPLPFTPVLQEIKSEVEKRTGEHFNSCLLNLYRDGKDSNGWHADDEKELGLNPAIASVSLGETRVFHLRHKADHGLKHKMELRSGSLLLMRGTTQHFWQHQIPKTKREIDPRINLTFRFIQ